MKIPGGKYLAGWARELIEECAVSRPARLSQYREWTQIFYTGSDTDVPSKRNRCFSHIDKLASFLFSPSEVEFDVDFDGVNDEPRLADQATRAQDYFNRLFARRGCDVAFSEANQWALVKGACMIKQVWGRGGWEPWVIQPEFFGVLHEGVESLDRQEAFTHTFFVTESQFKRMVANHPDRRELVEQVQASFVTDDEGLLRGGGGLNIVTGGGWPNAAISVPGVTSSSNPQTYGTVDWTTMQRGPMLAPEVLQRLVRLTDLWVWNDKRDDWTTIRYVDPGLIIEGMYQQRNLSDCGPGEHPFVKVCTNPVPNYFWGRSEVQTIWANQRLLSRQVNNIDSIFTQQARPARAAIGAPGITDERLRVLLTAGGTLTESSPTGKIETFAPEMPQGAMEWINYLDACFDEAAGFTSIMQGEGEQGVRAGVHANTLMRTSSPRLRDRALTAEKQCADWGDVSFKMLTTKDATVLKTKGGQTFTLSQLPPDASVVVDSHTSSPAFSADNEQKMFALAQLGAVTPKGLLESVHPPKKDKLLAELEEQEKGRAEQMEELKKRDPEEWAKAVAGRRR